MAVKDGARVSFGLLAARSVSHRPRSIKPGGINRELSQLHIHSAQHPQENMEVDKVLAWI